MTWPPTTHGEFLALQEQYGTDANIGLVFNRSAATVYGFRRKFGVKPTLRAGRPRPGPWSDVNTAWLRGMWSAGVSLELISRRLHRSKSAISSKVALLRLPKRKQQTLEPPPQITTATASAADIAFHKLMKGQLYEDKVLKA